MSNEIFFWCSSGEDGTRIDVLTRPKLEKRLAECAQDVEAGAYKRVFLDHIPESDNGYWIDVKEGAVVIIKGTVVIPKAAEVVKRYEIE